MTAWQDVTAPSSLTRTGACTGRHSAGTPVTSDCTNHTSPLPAPLPSFHLVNATRTVLIKHIFEHLRLETRETLAFARREASNASTDAKFTHALTIISLFPAAILARHPPTTSHFLSGPTPSTSLNPSRPPDPMSGAQFHAAVARNGAALRNTTYHLQFPYGCHRTSPPRGSLHLSREGTYSHAVQAFDSIGVHDHSPDVENTLLEKHPKQTTVTDTTHTIPNDAPIPHFDPFTADEVAAAVKAFPKGVAGRGTASQKHTCRRSCQCRRRTPMKDS